MKTATIGGKKIILGGQAIEIDGLGMSLETFLTIAEFAMTGTDLLGSATDSVDPRHKFQAVMTNLHRTDGFGAGATRFKAPHYLTMHGTGSLAPMG